MRTAARRPLILIAASALAAAPAAAQSHVSFSVGVGSLFDGVSFGFHAADYGPGSVFVGATLGLGWSRHYGSSYGIYSDNYDWYGPRSYAPAYSCWDAYWDTYWDPWGGWYDACVVAGPVWYGSYHARSWRSRHGWGYPSTFVYWADPFHAPWGPYWAYDPFDWYWDGYWAGSWGSRGWGYPYGVRTVYAYGGRRGTAIYRPSPLWRGGGYGTTYKENPRGTVGRTATRRPSGVAAPAAAPSRGPGRTAIQRPSGRTTPSTRTATPRLRPAQPIPARAWRVPAPARPIPARAWRVPVRGWRGLRTASGRVPRLGPPRGAGLPGRRGRRAPAARRLR